MKTTKTKYSSFYMIPALLEVRRYLNKKGHFYYYEIEENYNYYDDCHKVTYKGITSKKRWDYAIEKYSKDKNCRVCLDENVIIIRY